MIGTTLHDLASLALVAVAVGVGWVGGRLLDRVVTPLVSGGVGSWEEDGAALAIVDTVWLSCRACGGLETPHRRDIDGHVVCLWCPAEREGAGRG